MMIRFTPEKISFFHGFNFQVGPSPLKRGPENSFQPQFPAKCLTASDPLTFFFRIFHGEGTKITHQPPSPKCGFDVIIPKDDHQILPEQ